MRTTIASVMMMASAAACGGGKTAPPAPDVASAEAATPVAAAPTPAKTPGAIPCPDGDARSALARAAFAAPAESEVEASCVALVANGVAVWLLDGAFTTPDMMYELRTQVIDPRSRKVLSSKSGMSDHNSLYDYVPIDLDGDGSTELVQDVTEGANGVAAEDVVVFTVLAGALVELDRRPVRYENTGAVSMGWAKKLHKCWGYLEVVDGPGGARQLSITGDDTRHGGPPAAECPRLGKHVYGFVAGRLQETN